MSYIVIMGQYVWLSYAKKIKTTNINKKVPFY